MSRKTDHRLTSTTKEGKGPRLVLAMTPSVRIRTHTRCNLQDPRDGNSLGIDSCGTTAGAIALATGGNGSRGAEILKQGARSCPPHVLSFHRGVTSTRPFWKGSFSSMFLLRI
ncbi:unnamed protein product [Ectocarpus sp. 12 AP-2014]